MSKGGRLATLVVALGASLALAVPGAWAKVMIKCATSTQPSHIYNLGMEHMAKLVKEKSKGELDIQVYPGAQLGSEKDAVEGLQLGALEMTLTSTGPLGGFVPEVKLFNLPFLFKDRKDCYAVLDGKIGAEIEALFPKVGIRSLGWFENGFRNITSSKRPINAPADMKGQKIRVMEDELFIATMRALGAVPQPMPFGELYTALEQKTVDAQENPLAVIYSSRFFEVQKHLALTGHFYSPSMLLVSEAFWKKLSSDQQNILTEAARAAKDYERELSRKADQELVELCRQAGMEVTTPAKEPFMKAVAKVYEDQRIVKAIGGGDQEKGKALIQAAQKAAAAAQ